MASKQEDADPHRDEQSVRARRLRTTPRHRRPLMEESKGTFKHSAKYDAMKAKYGAGGERRERPSRRESPAATPQGGRPSRASGTATGRAPGEKSKLLERDARRGKRDSKGGSRGTFNFCKVSDARVYNPTCDDRRDAA